MLGLDIAIGAWRKSTCTEAGAPLAEGLRLLQTATTIAEQNSILRRGQGEQHGRSNCLRIHVDPLLMNSPRYGRGDASPWAMRIRA